jgi:hypothetical protein
VEEERPAGGASCRHEMRELSQWLGVGVAG